MSFCPHGGSIRNPRTDLSEVVAMAIGSIMVRMDVSIKTIAREIAGEYDLVGVTTSYNQLPENLSLCRKLRE